MIYDRNQRNNSHWKSRLISQINSLTVRVDFTICDPIPRINEAKKRDYGGISFIWAQWLRAVRLSQR
ncbi:MAG: hypothetical protein EBU88_09375 [Acidobacteria bacterium]|nr:hypothetical protein [Acidobacteriota bacterium]